MGRSFASRVSNRRLKWVILVFWLVVAAAAGPLAGGLTDEQDNEVSSWLPGDAESTLAIEQQAALGSDPDIDPGRHRLRAAGGRHRRGPGRRADDATELRPAGRAGRRDRRPDPVEDGEAIQLVVPLNLGPDGWDTAPRRRRHPGHASDDGPRA